MKKYKKFFSKVFAGVTIVCLLLGGNVGVAEAATFTFNQTDWSGGASVNTAIHPTNQTGWNKFSSASSTVKTSTAGEISLNSTTASITKTTDTDFSGGTFANTTVSGTGTAAKIRLAHSELAANATSLVGLWRMNGTVGTSPTTSGSVTDSQTNVAANHGTGYNSGSGLAYQPGELNQALQFDGTNDYVYMSSYTALAYPKTFEFWAMTDSVSQGGGARVILEKGSGTAVAVTILNRVIYVDTDDATSGTQYNTSNVGAVFDNDVWNHVAIVLTTATTGTMYVNGQGYSFSTSINTGGYGGSNGLYIGTDTGYYFKGLIDELAIYNTALSAETIQGHYNNTPSLSGTYTSATIDLGQKINFSTLGFTKTTNASTTLTVDIRAGNTASPDGTWTAWQTNVSSGGSISGLNGNQYVQYRANLSTTDTIYTPSLDDITINYSYYYSSGSLISSAYDTTDSANLIGKIQWTESLPSGTDIKFQLRTSPDNSTWTNWLGPIGTSDYYTDPAGGETINSTHRDGINDRWVQYKVFTESDGAYTPTLSDVTLTYVVNAPPQFESAPVVLQIANSADPNWGKVQIQYSVRDPDTTSGTNRPGNDVIPSFEYNIGSGWQAITAGYLNSGALDAKIVEESNYTTYTAYWDAKAQIPESYIASAQIRVTIDDGEAANNTAQAAGNTFVLDTKNPVVSVSSFTIDSSADTVSYNFSVTDDSNITREYRISNNSDLSNDTLNASSTQWNAMPSSSVTATSAWNFTGSPSFETVYLGARGTDIYGNAATSTTASSTAPSQPQNFMIYDISNPNNNDFKEFMSWQIYTSTTTAQFSNYKLYRSVDGINYSLLSAITDINQNYYTDTAVASTTTYYYQLNITDSDNDISSYSVPQNDLPDGQGGSDFTAPVISSVSAAEVQATWARITWTTDELSNSKVEFSTQSAGNYASTTTSISYVTSHEIFISDLAPNTEYVFRVKSTDVMSNEGSAPGGSFLTLGGPIISDVTTESVSDQGAVIFWNTNKDSDSYVIYSTNASLSGSSEIGNPAMVGSPYQHRVTLSGLTPRTTYYYYVKSTDSDNNISLDKNDGNYYSFATTYDTKPPVISNISTPVKTSSAIVIIWQTDELANSQVEYGRTSGIYTDFPALDSVLSINHAYTLTSLSESATYYYRVKSADANANQAISLEQTATTTSAREIVIQQVGGGGGIAVEKDTTAPVISNIQVLNIAAFEATISFSTNESVVGFALYGKGTTYGNTAGSSEFMTSHSIKLSGLKLGTEYHYKVTAVDRSGNTSISEDKTFSTKFAAEALEELMTLENAEQFQEDLEGMIESVMPSLVPPVISQVEVSDVTESSATVSWRSNVPAYGTLAYAAEKDYQSYNVELSQVEKKTREHKIELTGLSPATIYHIQARSFVFPGVVGKSKDITFSTKASKVKPEISKLGNTELEVRWVTEKETSSFAEYTNLITKKVYRVGDSTRVRTHNLKLENLIPDTPYEIRTFGYDENNILVEGDPLKIRTKKDTVAPGISAIRIDNALLPGRTDKLQSVISWKTDEPANSLVYFEEGVGISEELANTAGYENEYTTDHIVILTNLKPATVYRIRVASADESDNLTKSPIRTILTPRSPESVFDVIIRNFQDTFGFLKKLQ